MFDVTSVGILVADLIVKPVDKMPEKGLLSLVDSIEIFSGGNAMTAAVNIHKMGLETAAIGMVGNDFFGQFLEQKLEESGIDKSGVKRSNAVQTSTSVLMLSDDGERTFFHCKAANAAFSVDDVDWSIIENSKIVFVTGTYLLDTFDGAQTAQFLKKCKEMGKTTALDVCWNANGNWQELIFDAIKYIDLFMPSYDEAVEISGKTDLTEISDVFFQKGAGRVIIKCGSRGCFVRENAQSSGVMLPALKGVKAVDTTGAGDSFCSGFLAAYSRGNSLQKCAEFANAAGAMCVTAKGATTGMKSYDEVWQFMEQHKNI